MATKVVGFRIELQGDDELTQDILGLTKQLKKLTDQKKELDKELKSDATNKSAEDVDKLNKEIAETELNIKATRGELNKQQKDFLKIRSAITDAAGSYNELVKRNKELRTELKALPDAFDSTNQAANKLKTEILGVTNQLKKFDKEIGDSFREVGNYEKALKGAETRLDKLNTELKDIAFSLGKNSKEFKNLRIEVGKTEKELKNLQNITSKGVDVTGKGFDNLSQSLTGVGQGIGGINLRLDTAGAALRSIIPQISKFGGIFGIAAGAIVVGAGVAVDALLDLTREINKANSEVTKLFGVTDIELQKLTSRIQATADTFGKDFNEVLIVANTLSKEFGISGEEALDKINQGFLAGADINGEFLDILREYPTQFRESGFSADEFISIITAQTTEGIFSDKGIDAVKEFGLSIREQTEPVKKALEDAFGKKFSDKLLKGIRDGSISTAEALKQVTTGLKDQSIQADRTGAILADLFKGAGEDAGLRFIQSLSNINTNLGELVDETDKYTISQLKLLETNERIEFAQQQIVAAFDLTGNELSGLTKQFTAFIFETLVKLINAGVDVVNFFIDFQNESAVARAAFEFFGAGINLILDAVVLNFTLMVDGAKTVSNSIRALANLDFSGFASAIKKGFGEAAEDVTDFGKKTATNFSAAFEETIKQRKPIERINKETLFKPAEKAGKEAGKAAGDAFNVSITTTTLDQKTKDALAKKTAKATEKAAKAAEKAAKKQAEKAKKRAELKLKIQDELIILSLQAIENETERELTLLSRREDQKIAKQRERFDKGLITLQEFEDAKRDIQLISARNVDALLDKQAAEMDEDTEAEGFLGKLFGFNEEEQAAFTQQIKDFAAQISEDINEIFFANKQKRLQEETNAELSKLEEQKNAELDNANLTEEQKLAIETRFDKQRAAIELEAAKRTRKLEAQQAIVSAFLSAGRALAVPPGPPFTIPSAALALGLGFAQAAKIRATPLAKGADFVTDGPQLLLVGDNPGGKESVQVTPLSSPNINGPQVNQNFVTQQQGTQLNDARVAAMIADALGEIRVVVSEAEITRTQKSVKVIQDESGFSAS